jgi:hypothetical protein
VLPKKVQAKKVSTKKKVVKKKETEKKSAPKLETFKEDYILKKSRTPIVREKISSHQKRMSKYYSKEKKLNYSFNDIDLYKENVQKTVVTKTFKFAGYCPDCNGMIVTTDFSDSYNKFICPKCGVKTCKTKLMKSINKDLKNDYVAAIIEDEAEEVDEFDLKEEADDDAPEFETLDALGEIVDEDDPFYFDSDLED